MKKIVVGKEEHDGTVLLTFRFKALGQLLDEGDPTPLPQKELTGEAEEALTGYLDEYRVGRPARIIIELPVSDLTDNAPALLIDAVRHHFGFRIKDMTHDLKISRREGLYSFIVSLVNGVAIVLFLYYLTINEIPYETFSITLTLGFLTILNWVTIWDTYEHFVYDYRNLARRRRIFEKITTIPLTIRGY